ncbi:hypothetical protein Tco_1385733 [Tanacetum coccineum]
MKNPMYKYKKKKKKSGNNDEGSSTAANDKLCKRRRFLLDLMVKNDISPKGFKIVKGRGALSKLSNDLRKLHKEAIAIKNLEAHLYINKDSKLVMDSVENVIHIVARYRKRMKDYPFCWQTLLLSEVSGKYACKFPKEGLISPEFHRIPRMKGSETVKKVTDCSTLDELNRATVVPLVDPSAVLRNGMLLANDPNTNLPKENEEKIWTEFIKFDKETGEKKTIEVDHPIVSVIGNFAINAFNNACEMHVKKGEHNNLHDFEFVVCGYSKFGTAYHFYMTIEAIEEGNLGTYLAEVICNSSGGARTLCKFVLTDQEPLGTKALAVYYLSCLRTIYKTVDG